MSSRWWKMVYIIILFIISLWSTISRKGAWHSSTKWRLSWHYERRCIWNWIKNKISRLFPPSPRTHCCWITLRTFGQEHQCYSNKHQHKYFHLYWSLIYILSYLPSEITPFFPYLKFVHHNFILCGIFQEHNPDKQWGFTVINHIFKYLITIQFVQDLCLWLLSIDEASFS